MVSVPRVAVAEECFVAVVGLKTAAGPGSNEVMLAARDKPHGG